MIDVIFYFGIYSFLGWLLETIFKSITEGKFINRGFLHGPFTPIYGFGALLIIQSSTWSSLLFTNDLLALIFAVFLSIILVTLLELITGMILEKVFDLRWWDYSENTMNLKGFICLKYSLLWGLLALFLIKGLHPIVVLAITFIPFTVKEDAVVLFVLYFILDTIKSVMDTLDLRNTIINYRLFSEREYREKILKYKRIYLAFPRLLRLNARVLNRDV